jgi:hypothetical protein
MEVLLQTHMPRKKSYATAGCVGFVLGHWGEVTLSLPLPLFLAVLERYTMSWLFFLLSTDKPLPTAFSSETFFYNSKI